jgi:ribose 5-phosphate isomerase B
MRFVVGSDHGGFPLKAPIIAALQAAGHEVLDLGTFSQEPADYPDIAREVTGAIVRAEAERGVLVCGSGVGVSVAANKVPGIRAAVCHDTYSGHQGVEHDDMNVLCIGARVVGGELAIEIVDAFQGARFSGAERHVRRLAKVADIERRYMREERVGA